MCEINRMRRCVYFAELIVLFSFHRLTLDYVNAQLRENDPDGGTVELNNYSKMQTKFNTHKNKILHIKFRDL